MTFDPTKPCALRGTSYSAVVTRVEILKVTDKPTNYGKNISGFYVDPEGEPNLETWQLDGRFIKGQESCLDLINVEPEPDQPLPIYTCHKHVVHKVDVAGQLTYAFACDPTEAQRIADVMNEFEGRR